MRRAIAATLSVWMAVLVVVCCCGSMAAAEGENPESCPLAKYSEHCNKQSVSDPSIPSVNEHGSDCMNCCSIVREVYQQSRKSENKVEFDARSLEIIEPERAETPSNVTFQPEHVFAASIIPHPKIHILYQVFLI